MLFFNINKLNLLKSKIVTLKSKVTINKSLKLEKFG